MFCFFLLLFEVCRVWGLGIRSSAWGVRGSRVLARVEGFGDLGLGFAKTLLGALGWFKSSNFSVPEHLSRVHPKSVWVSDSGGSYLKGPST